MCEKKTTTNNKQKQNKTKQKTHTNTQTKNTELNLCHEIDQSPTQSHGHTKAN
jgi:hypothetical protein